MFVQQTKARAFLCKSLVLVATLQFLALSASKASATEVSGSQGRGFYVEVPLVDAPFNFAGGLRLPSMSQSLELTAGSYEALHFGVGRLLGINNQVWWRRFLAKTAIVGIDLVPILAGAPMPLVWEHEEWHRAVMSRRGISSYNGVYDFRPGTPGTPVRKITDEALADFKAQHPAEFVRMSEAGMEAQIELNVALERNAFFRRTESWHNAVLWMNAFSNWSYMSTCADAKAVAEKNTKAERDEGIDVTARDFAGQDCLAWVYDLHRPSEAYEQRGPHPSGVGIRRYRRYEDLTSREQSYLRRQKALMALNFLDPNLFGLRWFSVNTDRGLLDFNAAVRYFLTSFGTAAVLDTFWKRGSTNLFVRLQGFANHERLLPGADANVEVPLSEWASLPGLRLGVRCAAWLQPKNQLFAEKGAKPGVLGSVRLTWAGAAGVEAYGELEGKTEGWVAGNVYLGPMASARVGVAVRL